MFSIFAGTSPDQVGEVVDLSIAELRDVAKNGVTEAELDLAKQQTVSSILLGLEDSAGRAATLAQSELIHGRQISVEEALEKINAVAVADIHALASENFRTEKAAFAVLGDLKGLEIERERLSIG